MPPVGALHEGPPLAPVAQVEGRLRAHEHQRAGIKHVRQRAGIVLWIGRNFGEGFVTGRLHELLELAVGHWGPVDPEAVDRDPMRRRFLGIMMVRSHAERAAGNPDHVVGLAPFRLPFVRSDVDPRQRHGAHSWRALRTGVRSRSCQFRFFLPMLCKLSAHKTLPAREQAAHAHRQQSGPIT